MKKTEDEEWQKRCDQLMKMYSREYLERSPEDRKKIDAHVEELIRGGFAKRLVPRSTRVSRGEKLYKN